jgi:putative endonuclease
MSLDVQSDDRRRARQARAPPRGCPAVAPRCSRPLWLMAKGYRILGFRLATPLGEIDLLAQRGDILAVVEVKQRATLEAALDAVTWEQRARLRRAAAHIAPSATACATRWCAWT